MIERDRKNYDDHMTGPALRPMKRGDIALIAAWMVQDDLWQRYGLTTEIIGADFERGLQRGDLLLVVDAELPARGFAWCLPEGMFGAFPYLKRFGIDPAYAGRGIGNRLLAGLEQELLDRQRSELFLLVSDFNTGAQRFYRQHGYDELGRISELVLVGVAEVLLRKQLTRLA